MPISPRETLLCRYRYDPLDRSIDWAPDRQASIQRFYCKSRLASEIQGAAKYSFLQHDEQVLAQQRQVGDKVDTTLLATDQQGSVLNALDTTRPDPRAYSPYGHHPFGNGLLSLLSLLGFNGERPDPVTGHYHLGNGYRQFNPTLMRFNSPDSWSPFEKGGLNAYMYCGADPINRSDPTGHVSFGGIGALITGSISAVTGTVLTLMAASNNEKEATAVGAVFIAVGLILMAGGTIMLLPSGRPRAPSFRSNSSSISLSTLPPDPRNYPGSPFNVFRWEDNLNRNSYSSAQPSITAPLDNLTFNRKSSTVSVSSRNSLPHQSLPTTQPASFVPHNELVQNNVHIRKTN